MANSIDEATAYAISKLKELLTDISEYEEGIIRKAMFLPYTTTTNAKTVLSDRIDDAIKCKADLNYVILRIKDKKKVVQVPYDTEYNRMFTVLTRQNRPSKQAIDSEIKYTKPGMADTANRLEEFDKILEYLNSLLAVLDLVIRNSENRRYNL